MQILATVAEVLRPRAELAALLAPAAKCRAGSKPLGVPALLRTVRLARPTRASRCATRGTCSRSTCATAAGSRSRAPPRDGSFARGRARAARSCSASTAAASRSRARAARCVPPFGEPLDQLIGDGLQQLGAVLDAVSDTRLLRVDRITFDDAILSALLSATPTALADAAARLRAGEPPRSLLMDAIRHAARSGATVA